MKLEQLIAQYFYQNRQLTLHEIGTFTINPDVSIPAENEKDFMLPANALQFQYDGKAGYDEGLIDYIVEHTRKIRPLAASDLDSYVSLNKQVLNIGRPLVIEGLGTLQKTQAGDYVFTQQNAYASKKIESAPIVIKEKVNKDISFQEARTDSSKTAKSILMVLVGIAALGALVAAAYYFYYNKKDNTQDIVQLTTTDTSSNQKTPDSSKASTTNDSATLATPNPTHAPTLATSNGFNLFINKYPNLMTAEKKLAKMQSYGHNTLKIITSDSVTYQIVMAIDLPLSDTLKAKDSIKKIFPGTYIVK